MKQKLRILLLALVCVSLLTGCFCEHEWKEADCVNPATCINCEKTEGDALGHVWMAATCEAPKTCEVCGQTDGEPKGHSWSEATCEEPKTCSACHLTEGEALGHNWLDATTEDPKTCETCNITEGERIITDPRFTTDSAKHLIGQWVARIALTGEDMDVPDFEGELTMLFIINFGPAGDLHFDIQLAEMDTFMEYLVTSNMKDIYDTFAAEGYDKEAADAAIMEVYGMPTEEYVRDALSKIDINQMVSSMFASLNISGVYYVDGSYICTGDNWESDMVPEKYTITDGVLVIDNVNEALQKDISFTRAEE